jgi:hypothetical protein
MSFTASSIQKNAPETSGVYGISNSREWLFIGESANIQAALMEHLRERGTPLSEKRPTGFQFEVASPSDRMRRQNTLVREFHPVIKASTP